MVTLGNMNRRSIQAAPTQACGQSTSTTRRGEQEVVGADVTVQQGRAGGGLGPPCLELGQPVQVRSSPGGHLGQPGVVTRSRQPPPTGAVLGPLVGDGRGVHRGGGQVHCKGGQGGEHLVQLLGPPRLRRGVPVDVLEHQRDSVPVVVGPQYPRRRHTPRERGRDPRLGAVD
jgi:hypothetical protein